VKKSYRFIHIALLFGSAFLQARGASASWNVNAAGNWATAGSWTPAAAPGSTSTDNADVATFSFTLTAARTATVDTRFIGGISFGNTSAFGYTLSGGALNLNSGGVIQTLAADGAHTETISTPIKISGTSAATASFTGNATSATSLLSIGAVTGSATTGNTTTLTLNGTNTGANAITGVIGNGTGGGSLAITKSAAGLWTLSGANTYTGVTTINGGILQFAKTASLYNNTPANWTPANIVVGNGGTAAFNVGGTGEFTTGNVTTLLTNLSTITSNGLLAGSTIGFNTTNAAGSTFTVADTIANSTGTGSGAVGLTKLGANTLVLTGANTYTGLTTINAGTLSLSGGTDRLKNTGTVNFSGAGTLNVGATDQTLANLTVTNTITGTVAGTTGGKLTLTGTPFALGGGASQTNTLTLSGLPTFAYNNSAGTFRVSGVTNSVTSGGAGVMTLAGGTNTITASVFGLGDFGSTQNTSINSGTVNLGKTNTINANTITIGGNRGAGALQYPAVTSPSLTLRASDGTSRVTSMTLSDQGGPNTTGTVQGVVDLTTNVTGTSTLDAMITTLTIGRNNRGGSAGGNSIVNTGTFTMGAGTLDATTIILGQILAGFTSGGTSSTTGNMSVSGGTIKVGNFYFADQQASPSSGTAALSATFNFNGGANLYATNIAKGTGTGTATATRTFNWNDGTIHNYDASSDLTIDSSLTVKLAATGTHAFTIDSSHTASVASALSDATTGGALTKSGGGTLTLSGVSTYTGSTTINAGIVKAGVASVANVGGALGTNSAVTLANTAGVSLDLNGFNTQIGSLAGGGTTGGNIILGAGSLTTGVNNTSTTYDGVISGTGGFTKSGSGIQTLTGGNIFSSTTAINAGTLKLDFSAATAPTDNIINNTANSSDLSMAGGSLTLVGKASTTNTQQFNGLTVTGGVNTIALMPDVTSNPMLLTLGAITRTGGTVDFTLPAGVQSASNGITTTTSNDATGILGTWATVGGTSYATNNGTNIVAYAGYTDVPFAGTIADGASTNIRLIGGTSGNVLLGSATTTVNSILQAQTTATTIDVASQTLRLGAGGGILLGTGTGPLTIGSTPGNGTLTAGGVDNTPGSLTLTNTDPSAVLTINSVIADNGSGVITLTKIGTGNATLAGVNTYTGDTSINAGTLQIGGAGQLGSGNYAGNIANNATFGYNSTAAQTLSGIISGTGGLTKANTGTLTPSGVNTYTGVTTVNGGILSVATIGNGGVAGTLGAATNAAANLVLGGGTLQYTGSTASTNRSFTLTASTNSTIEIGSGANLTVSGTSAATNGALTKTGLGTLTFTGTNAHTGGTTINDGTLQIGDGTTNGGFGTGTYSIGSTGTLKINDNASGAAAPTWANISGVGTLDLKTAKSFDTASFGTPTLPVGFTGTMVIEGGRVAPGTVSPYGMGNTSAVVVQPGGQLGLYNITGASFTVPGITIAGTGYGESGYEAALRLANTTVTGTVALSGNATIGAANGNTGILSNVVSGSGFTLTVGTANLAGTIRLTGVNTYTGNTTIVGGTTVVEIGGAGQLNSGNYAGDITSAGTFKYNSTADQTLSGVISSTGTVVKDNTGTLTLTGTNTYTSTTTVSGGTLLVNGAKNGGGSVSVASGATIGGTGTIAGTTTVNSGGFLAPGDSSAGTLTLAAATLAGTYNCQLDVSTGDRVTVTGALTINSGAAITVSTIGTPTAASYIIASYGSLVGTLPTITGIPAGYTLDTSTTGQVKLVKSGYTAWAGGFAGLTDATPGGDPDHDGISNLLEYVLGGDPRVSSSSILPTQSVVGSNLVLSYKRNDDSKNDTTQVGQWSTDLATWTDVTPVMVNDNGALPDDMTVTVPLANAVGGKLFLRLKVTQP